MNENFLIQYQETVPEEIIFEFQEDLKEFTVIVEKQPDSEYHYSTGNLFNDIVIFINENQTGLIVSGLIVRASYDLLKFSITKLIKGLKKKSPKEQTENLRKISINHRIYGKIIEFEIETNLSDDLIERAIDKSFDTIKQEQIKEILNNRDFLSKEYDYNQAKFIYNKATGLWEPINYGQTRKDFEDFQRKANEDFNC
ncbi:MAG: hypothetical protein A2W93_09510 [Bacteroidetes bacterium GWF2_43_63]|nr:MAG: hypothetical protein A2W94_05895 [Bacteroidetes bacterium GWE2_42_42]OFY54531.1 MAG: hypothetical protein A2W93_09510 [Bacteroidetes bacterium GWF2_43_63]HBG70483.1 hypothetical protein [Bacteroidales bacterium]HCB63399.1 hypothetical protein [Bacteroidales bacterium]